MNIKACVCVCIYACVQCTWWKVQIPKLVTILRNDTAKCMGECAHIPGVPEVLSIKFSSIKQKVYIAGRKTKY